MFKSIRKKPRQSKSFHSSFLANMAVALLLGTFFSLVLNQQGLPKWESNIIAWIAWLVLLVLCLIIAYKWGLKSCNDLKDKQNFYDNFFMSVFVIIVSTLLILYHSLLHNIINWLIAVLIIVALYFFLNWIFVELRPK